MNDDMRKRIADAVCTALFPPALYAIPKPPREDSSWLNVADAVLRAMRASTEEIESAGDRIQVDRALDKEVRLQALKDALKAVDDYPWNDLGCPTGVPTPLEREVCEANKRAIQRLIDEVKE